MRFRAAVAATQYACCSATTPMPSWASMPLLTLTLTASCGWSLEIALSVTVSVVCSGISSITWRMPMNRSQSSFAPAEASPT